MITLEPQDLEHFGLTYACGTCRRLQYVMFGRAKDGIEWCISDADLSQSTLSPFNLVAVRTEGAKLLISCGYCPSGKTILEILRAPGGTSCSIENSEDNPGRKQVQTSGPRCQYCNAFTTKTRVDSGRGCMKCEREKDTMI